MNNPEREGSYNKDLKVSFRILRRNNHPIASILGSYRQCLESDRRYDYHNTPSSIINFLDQKQRQSTRPTYENQVSNQHKSNTNSSNYIKQIDNPETNNSLNQNQVRRLKFKRKRNRNFTQQQQSILKEEVSIQLQKKNQVINEISQAQITVQDLHYQMVILLQRLKKINDAS